MPRCTWWGESGGSYRARNPHSTAGGKYQLLDSTFHGLGGPDYPGTHDAAHAPPLIQERIARRLLRSRGTRPWVLCP